MPDQQSRTGREADEVPVTLGEPLYDLVTLARRDADIGF